MSDFKGNEFYDALETRKKQYDNDKKDRKVIATIEVEFTVDYSTANDSKKLRELIKTEMRENSQNIQYRLKGVSLFKYWDNNDQ